MTIIEKSKVIYNILNCIPPSCLSINGADKKFSLYTPRYNIHATLHDYMRPAREQTVTVRIEKTPFPAPTYTIQNTRFARIVAHMVENKYGKDII